MSQFPIVPARTALLFFDTLNTYLHSKNDAARAAAEQSGVIPAMQKINQACRSAGIPVFYAQANHRPDRRDFAPLIVDRGHRPTSDEPYQTRSEGPTRGSWELEVIPEIAPEPADYVIKKHRWSAFYQTNLELSLRTRGVDTIMLAGGSTHVGVAATAYSAHDRDFNLIILTDAVRSGVPGLDPFFFEQVFPVFARMMSVDQAIADIQSPASSGG